MALSFNGLEPVTFGGKDCAPKITTETKLRLADINEYNDSADQVLASAFPEDESYVRNFLTEKMTILDKQTLHAYLLGGEQMVSALQNKISEVTNEN